MPDLSRSDGRLPSRELDNAADYLEQDSRHWTRKSVALDDDGNEAHPLWRGATRYSANGIIHSINNVQVESLCSEYLIRANSMVSPYQGLAAKIHSNTINAWEKWNGRKAVIKAFRKAADLARSEGA